MARPELRLFYTWAMWSEAARRATVDSGRLYTDPDPTGATVERLHLRPASRDLVVGRDARLAVGACRGVDGRAARAGLRRARAQAPATVNVSVDATAAGTPLERVWPFHGYDEINYTTAPEGKALLGTIAAAHTAPVHVRSHFLLNTGDGTPAMKWGSTNVYTEDAAGNPVYNWTLTDGIMDTITGAGAFPFVEIGFMPEALSTHPTPYRNSSTTTLDGGCFYPPDRLHEVGGAHPRVGDARERTLPERRGELAVGAVERTRHRLLERHVRRVREALRLHGIGAARGDPERARSAARRWRAPAAAS